MTVLAVNKEKDAKIDYPVVGQVWIWIKHGLDTHDLFIVLAWDGCMAETFSTSGINYF